MKYFVNDTSSLIEVPHNFVISNISNVQIRRNLNVLLFDALNH
jgi:hypothetical protein